MRASSILPGRSYLALKFVFRNRQCHIEQLFVLILLKRMASSVYSSLSLVRSRMFKCSQFFEATFLSLFFLIVSLMYTARDKCLTLHWIQQRTVKWLLNLSNSWMCRWLYTYKKKLVPIATRLNVSFENIRTTNNLYFQLWCTSIVTL